MAFLCQQCGRICKTAKDLKDHKNIHDENEYECGECGKHFTGKKNWRNHKAVHELIVCTNCNSEVPKNSRKSHLIKCKSSDVQFHCENCPYITKYKADLKRHEAKHKKNEEKEKTLFSCVHCFSIYLRYSYFKHFKYC